MPHIYMHLLQVQPFGREWVALNVKWRFLLLHANGKLEDLPVAMHLVGRSRFT
jgi:hypothetical protein